MEFDNSFSVQAPLTEVWEFMLNAQEVAPCVPGAAITEIVDETHYKGTVKVKLGAVQMTYRGELELQADEAAHTITLKAKGTETRGSGGASGTVTNRLSEAAGGGTQIDIHSQIDVTGKVAQFGRGIMQDVANRLIREFARCLEQKLQAHTGQQAGQGQPAGSQSTAPQTAAVAPNEVPSQTAATGPANVQPQAAEQQSASATPSSSPTPRPAPTHSSATTTSAAPNISLTQILMDITRERLAAALRNLAAWLEPK